MSDIEGLLKAAFAEMEKVMTANTVVGDPLTFEGKTIIPLVSIGMGFGAGGGTGPGKGTADRESGEIGTGGGAGGGVKIKPVAVVVLTEEGVTIENLKSALPASQRPVMEKIAETIPKVVSERVSRMARRDEEDHDLAEKSGSHEKAAREK